MKYINREFSSRIVSGGMATSGQWSEFALGAYLHFDFDTNTIVPGHEGDNNPLCYRVWVGISLNLMWIRLSLDLHA